MNRSLRVLVVGSILAGSVALAAVVIRSAEAYQVALQYVLGVGFLVLGAAFATLHLTLSDAFLRRHLGEPGAARMRRAWRGGWVGILLGSAMLGLLYLDHWVKTTAAEAQFRGAFNKGVSAAEAWNWPTAAEAFSEAIRLDPGSAKAYRNRGVAFLYQGEQDRALEDLSEAIRLDPEDASTRYNQGVAHSRRGDYDRALTDFAEALRLNPSYAKAYLARSRIHAKKGDDTRAKADRQKAAELDPSLEKSGDTSP